MFLEQMPDFAGGAVLVVGEDLDDHRRPARTVRFVLGLLVRDARLLTGAAANRALDVVGGHVVRLGVGDDRPQSRVHVGVAAAGPRRDSQLFDEARENLPTLGIRRALLVLDRMPLGMAGHVLELQKNQRIRDKSYHTARGTQSTPSTTVYRRDQP